MSALPTVAFLGIGLMGSRQAARLADAGIDLTIWNRSADKTAALGGRGVKVAATAAEAVVDADIVITMLTRGSTVNAILFEDGVAAAMKPGALVVDMSSIAPAEAREHAVRLAALGLRHLDAPVSGGTRGAEEGSLAIMVGGPAADFDAAVPVFKLMGRPTLVGPSGSGQVAKLANQMIVAITIGAVAEALVLAERAGADPAAVRQALRGGFAESRILELHGGRMISGDFKPGGATSNQIKDLENALGEASLAHSPAYFTNLAIELFRRTLKDHGDVDHSGLWLTLHNEDGV